MDLYDPVVPPIEVRRRIGMVFQKPNPFPKSIYDNVAFGPRVLGWKKADGPDGVAFFQLPGMIFGLFPHDELAKDMKMSRTTLSSYRGITLAYNARSEAEVDRIFAALTAKGVTIPKRRGDYLSDAEGLDKAVGSVRPRLCFFGHHHARVRAEVEGVPCLGLNIVWRPSYLVAIDIPASVQEPWTLLGEWPAADAPYRPVWPRASEDPRT